MLHFSLLIVLCIPLAAQTMRELGGQRGVSIGAAVNPQFFSEPAYAATLSREFSQVEPENAMKFQPIHPAANTYDWAQADQIVDYARTNGQVVRGHTLVWHNQLPTWVTNGNFTSQQLAGVLQQHIQNVVGRYAGKVFAWDVVNEAFNDNGTMRSTIWSDSPGIGFTGTGYIEQAFRWTHDVDPKALLFYNDYSAETVNAKSDAIYKMAQDFVARGVPIHGIGMQMHFTTSTGSLASIESNVKRIADLGLQVHITELDVRIAVDSAGNATPALLATQAQIYKDITALCLKFPLCTSIQTWGLTDRHSWIPGSFPGFGAALPFDANYQPKSAYTAIVASLSSAPPVISAAGITNSASYAAAAVSPGEIVVLFGPTFGPASLALAQADSSGKIGGLLSNTRLLFDGTPAPLLYSKVGQVSAIVPFAVAGKTTTQMVYEYRGVSSAPAVVTVTSAVPGLFTLDSSGKGPGAILDAGYRLNTQANPAKKDDVILLFATGGGLTNPASVDGQIATAIAPLAIPPTVKIGGVDCPVLYAGNAPALVAGAVQLNVQVAAGIPSGPQPVVMNIRGAESRSDVTVWVQ